MDEANPLNTQDAEDLADAPVGPPHVAESAGSSPQAGGESADHLPPERVTWLVWVRFALLLAGVALAVWGQVLLARSWSESPMLAPGWRGFFWLFSGMFLVALGTWRRQCGQGALADLTRWQPRWTVELPLALTILLIAILLRAWQLEQIPHGIFVDETEIAINGLDVLEGRIRSPWSTAWYEVTTLYMYTQAAFFKLFGLTLFALRLPAVVWGVVTIVAFYFLVRTTSGAGWALLAAALLATSRWHINLSRCGFVLINATMFLVLVMAFLVPAIRLRNEGPREAWTERPAVSPWVRALAGLAAVILVIGGWVVARFSFGLAPAVWHGMVLAAIAILLYLVLLFLGCRMLALPMDWRDLLFFAAGALLGLSQYSYLPARVFPVIIAALILFYSAVYSRAPLWGRVLLLIGGLGTAAMGGAFLELCFRDGAWPLLRDWSGERSVLAGHIAFFLDHATLQTKLVFFGLLGLSLLLAVGCIASAVFYSGFFRRYWPQIVMAFCTAMAVYYPLQQHYRQVQGAFDRRAQEVRLDTLCAAEKSAWPIWVSQARYLAMFNFKGSDHARHNIPYQPMLDPILGVCLALGFGIALSRLLQPYPALLLIWFCVGLQAGALTRLDEYAHAIRVTHVLPAAILLIVLFLNEAMRVTIGLFDTAQWVRWSAVGCAAAMAGVLLVAMVRDPYRYFTRQTNHSPQEYIQTCGPQTDIAYRVKDHLARGDRIYLDEQFRYFSSIRFLNWPDSQLNDPYYFESVVPFPYEEGHDVVVIVTADQPNAADKLRPWYPHLQALALRHERLHPQPYAYEVRIPAADVTAAYGADVQYQVRTASGEVASTTRTVPTLEMQWTTDVEQELATSLGMTALPSGAARSMSISGLLRVGKEMKVTLEPVIAAYGGNANRALRYRVTRSWIQRGLQPVQVDLRRGAQVVECRLEPALPGAAVALHWTQPGQTLPAPIPHEHVARQVRDPNVGLTGYYYQNATCTAPPVLVRDDQRFEVDPVLGERGPYCIAWRGTFIPPAAGMYRFECHADDGAALRIGDVDLFNADYVLQAELELEARPYPFELRYWNQGGAHNFLFFWSPPYRTRERVPADVFRVEPLQW